MKKIILFLFIIASFSALQAKMVKFSVDMYNEVLDSGGIHITGDFQSEAGFPGGDWLPNTTEMLNEAGTSIFSVIVNIPAFQKFEYKFINGSGTYGLEFVPVESRVDEVVNDNRWIYIDSLSNDTMKIGAIMFSGNAPKGKLLLRHKVDMQNEASIPPTGVHVQGSYQNWNPATTRLYSFDGKVYQYIAYLDSATSVTADYNYVNGNTAGNTETVPSPCAVAANQREMIFSAHTVLDTVCFSSCSACMISSITDITKNKNISFYPNPMQNSARLESKDSQSLNEVTISDLTGKQLRSYTNCNAAVEIEKGNLSTGVYILTAKDSDGKMTVMRFVVE